MQHSTLVLTWVRQAVEEASSDQPAEAFKAIISFSASPQELLQRKKITRKILLQYAFAEKINITGNADKMETIGKILSHWHKEKTNLQPTQLENHVNPVSPSQIVNPIAPSQNLNPVIAPPTGDLYTFGLNFASWFYKMLNSHNRQMNASPPLDFGPQHFWPDSTLQANTETDGIAIGAVKTAEKLLYFVKEGLYFNANLNDGVSTKSESHGLICVVVHGTVHQEKFCLGTFEQAFTLLQDPVENNWKIKTVWLNVHMTKNESHCILSS